MHLKQLVQQLWFWSVELLLSESIMLCADWV